MNARGAGRYCVINERRLTGMTAQNADNLLYTKSPSKSSTGRTTLCRILQPNNLNESIDFRRKC